MPRRSGVVTRGKDLPKQVNAEASTSKRSGNKDIEKRVPTAKAKATPVPAAARKRKTPERSPLEDTEPIYSPEETLMFLADLELPPTSTSRVGLV